MGEAREIYRSTLADHPDIKGVLPRFVARLPGHVRRLRELQAAGDTTGLQLLVHQLRGAGQSFGFAPLSALAGEAEDLILAGGAVAEVTPALLRLISYMERVEGYGANL